MPNKSLKKVKEYEDRVNRIIHQIILNDQGIANLELNKDSFANVLSNNIIPKIKKKETSHFKKLGTLNRGLNGQIRTKGSLLNNFTQMVDKKKCTFYD